MYPGPDDPLRVAYLSYRGKPHVGGQGVYTRHLTKALVDLGHTVEVLGGQPYPVLDERVRLTKLPSLDIFNDHYPGRFPAYWEIRHLGDVVEILQFSTGTFSEPLAFSVRAWQELKGRRRRVRPRARQPEPRLRPPRHREAPADHRHAPPPDHGGSPSGDGARADAAQAHQRRPVVLVREDAGQGGPPDAPHRRGERELDQGHPRRHGRRHGAHAPRARRCRPRPVQAPPRHRARSLAASSPRPPPTSP